MGVDGGTDTAGILADTVGILADTVVILANTGTVCGCKVGGCACERVWSRVGGSGWVWVSLGGCRRV